MEQYLQLVEKVLSEGSHKPNRTGVDTVSDFSQSYTIDLQEGFPLLTTKDMSGFRWKSLIHELLWYFSGEHHIRNLQQHTSIWDAWADDDGNLETAYGRFWRRYPVPEENTQLDGEAWVSEDNQWVTREENGGLTIDQIQYVIDTLNGDNPDRGPNSRRLVVTPWHPANAEVSKLPPCHAMFIINVQNGKLNTHLTQRSGDIALGIPFNIAAYSLITHLIASQTDFEVGEFSHTIVDAHIYCGKDERGEWYSENLEEVRKKIQSVEEKQEFLEIKDWIEENAPEEEEEGYDHIPGLLKQLSREPRERPEINIAEKKLDDLKFDDIEIKEYDPHPGLRFEVAE